MRKLIPHSSVDVICQHTADGKIIPLRIRLTDEDGQWQTYNIKEYKDVSHMGTRNMPDGMYITNTTPAFECKIRVFDCIRRIRLYYDAAEMIWTMTG